MIFISNGSLLILFAYLAGAGNNGRAATPPDTVQDKFVDKGRGLQFLVQVVME
jgi:hypothetical protein